MLAYAEILAFKGLTQIVTPNFTGRNLGGDEMAKITGLPFDWRVFYTQSVVLFRVINPGNKHGNHKKQENGEQPPVDGNNDQACCNHLQRRTQYAQQPHKNSIGSPTASLFC